MASSEPATPAAPEPAERARFAFPEVEQPHISVVVTSSGSVGSLTDCLALVAAESSGVAFEVIVVDDASLDGTSGVVSGIQGVKLVRNESPVGEVGSRNRGALEARSPVLVFLSDRARVRRGWLARLASVLDAEVGLVGPKLLDPGESLINAGGIVFSDGTMTVYGKNGDPGGCGFNYLREVDFLSKACLLVTRRLFDAAGGFAGGECAAVDLAFTARSLGYRVIFHPKSEVMLAEPEPELARLPPELITRWSRLLAAQPPAATPVLWARDRRRHRVLVIYPSVPRYDLDAGSVRMDALISTLESLGYAVILLPDDRNPRMPYTERFQLAGVEVLYGDYDLAELVRALEPELDLCIASTPAVGFKYLQTIREYAPGCSFVFDTVDLHFVREQRRAEVEGGRGREKVVLAYRELELALVRASDATVTVTETERQILRREVPAAKTHVIPMIHVVNPHPRPFEDREGLLFVGGFAHRPNVAAIQYFLDDIFPAVRKGLPRVKLDIVGSNPPEFLTSLVDPGVVVHGHVPDVGAYLQRCRVSIVPLTYGAGLKGKLTQSVSEGVPVVTTPVGAEGSDLVDGENVLVAADPSSFASSVIRLYSDPGLWKAISESGLKHAEAFYSPAAARLRLQGLLSDVGVGGRRAE